ncbi:HAD-IA family hydrolase [Streptomyces sp. NPDC088725]|uniref:HAD-IA family hydrolase n=1 Tax=Streptomyces sp. NPDC088725 TaxID=3365873 RepID=UPI0038059262
MRASPSVEDNSPIPYDRSSPWWVVFDYGEVLSLQTDVRPAMAELLHVPVPDFCDAWASERYAYDRGASDTEYWWAVGARLGVPVDEELAARLTAIDISGWIETRPEALALLAELAEARIPLALLSNAPYSHARVFRRQPWAASFRHLLFSGELGMAKPQPEVWDCLTEQLGARASDLLFLDDRQENVDSARAAGLRAEHWTTTDRARDRLVDFGLCPYRPEASPPEDASPADVQATRQHSG